MANLIKKVTAGADKNILIAPELAFAISVQVTNTGVSADSNGRKIIKAGTPIGSSTNVLLNRQTLMVSTNTSTNGAQAQGIVLHDVDVTDGAATATMLVAGYVDANKVPSFDSTVKLDRIVLVKGE